MATITVKGKDAPFIDRKAIGKGIDESIIDGMNKLYTYAGLGVGLIALLVLIRKRR